MNRNEHYLAHWLQSKQAICSLFSALPKMPALHIIFNTFQFQIFTKQNWETEASFAAFRVWSTSWFMNRNLSSKTMGKVT